MRNQFLEATRRGQSSVTNLRQGLPKAGSSPRPGYKGSRPQGWHQKAQRHPKLRVEAAHRSARKSGAHGGVVPPAGATPTAKAAAPAP
ncbi:hypothetical protein BHE74_00041485 [Ensete ventricosum]|nr:hypothetical protein GW17_00046430 [Ensete ventricosum]RWW52119.1 hypothetical protein BHE74_00041485 [Ensete ventricosum]RZR82004.1 hypothetical protein BHM03_00008340 [Ensete ventricosum]